MRARFTPGWFRRLLDAGVARLARLMLHVFFREIGMSGLDYIPAGVPLVFVANHNNSVVDAVLLLALPGARPRMLAKSTLFSHPVMGPLLALAGALPVYRRRDPGVDVALNLETFARCRAALAAGGQIALFPEGTSHSQERGLPIKNGAARIVLETEALHGPLGLRIIPVGLAYEAKERFRSRVWVRVGQSLDPAAELAAYRHEPKTAVRALTARIAAALESATAGPERRGRALEALPTALSRPLRLAHRIVTLPVFVVGCALNWIPYRIPGWLSDALSRTPDEPATYKLLAGLVAFPLFWAAEAALVAKWAGPAWGLAVALLAPATGYAALRFHEEARPEAGLLGLRR